MDYNIVHLEDISFYLYAVVVLLIATALSFFIGFEREFNGHQAGLRTHVIVGLFGCLAGLISFYYKAYDSTSAAILIGGVISIALVSAFSITQTGKDIKGLTTAVTILLVGLIGIGCGLGFCLLSFIVCTVALIVLIFLSIFESKTSKADPYVILYVDQKSQLNDEILKTSSIYGLKISNISSKVESINQEDVLKVIVTFEKTNMRNINAFAKDLATKVPIKKYEIKPTNLFNHD